MNKFYPIANRRLITRLACGSSQENKNHRITATFPHQQPSPSKQISLVIIGANNALTGARRPNCNSQRPLAYFSPRTQFTAKHRSRPSSSTNRAQSIQTTPLNRDRKPEPKITSTSTSRPKQTESGTNARSRSPQSGFPEQCRTRELACSGQKSPHLIHIKTRTLQKK